MTKLRLLLLATTALTAMQFAGSASHAEGKPILVAQAQREELGPDGKPKQPPAKGAPPPAAAPRPAPPPPAAAPHPAPPPPAAAPPPAPPPPRIRRRRRPAHSLRRGRQLRRLRPRIPCSRHLRLLRRGRRLRQALLRR